MLHMFVSIIRTLFAMIDTLVLWLIETLYVLLVKIAYTNVFGDFIYQMLGRVYVFLGIFMLFKLSMSMITYIINPDALTDKGKGFGKLITNVIISLVLVVTVPTLFKEAFRLQGIILNTNAVYQIVTGKKVSVDLNDSNSDLAFIEAAEQSARQIGWGVFQPFVYTDLSDTDLKALSKQGINWLLPMTTSKSGSKMCSGGTKVATVNVQGDVANVMKLENGGYCLEATRVCVKASCLLNRNTVTASVTTDENLFWFDDKEFLNDYKFLISTLAGAVVAYCFLVFCFDAAMRAIKLGMLQIVAPIPILSMIDPGTGTKKIKTWATECGKEFAGLFIRLASVFFATEVINLVLNPERYNSMNYYAPDGGIGNVAADGWVKLFIIIGALLFAKELPKWIENILGIKLSGDGFNLKKRLSGAVGLGAAAGVAGLGAKKMVAGLDAVRNGRKFSEGSRKIQGNGFISKMQKGYREMTPFSTEARDKRREGQSEVRQLESSKKRGEEIKKKIDSLVAGGMTEDDANIQVFGQKYGKSMNDLKDAKKAKINAQQELEKHQRELQAAMTAKANGKTHYATLDANGNIIEMQVDDFIMRTTDVINGTNHSKTNVAGINYSKAAVDAQDKVDKLNEAHKSLQKSDATHARMETDLKTYKTVK